MRKISNEFYQGELAIITFLVIFEGQFFSSFSLFASLPSVATDDRKQFQCRKIVLLTKVDIYFWNSIDAKTLFSFLQRY